MRQTNSVLLLIRLSPDSLYKIIITLTSFHYTVLFFIVFTSQIFSQYQNAPYYFTNQELGINKIKMPLDNFGGAYPRSHLPAYHDSIGTIVYDHGLFFIGKIHSEIYESHVLWESLFSPGPIINNKPAMQINLSDSLRYSVYKISRSDTIHIDSLDNHWPIDLGAPFSQNQKPLLYGDQTLWTIYNTYDSLSIIPKTSLRRPLYPVFPLEIHHTAFSYENGFNDSTRFLDETIFIEWMMINKGDRIIDSATVGLWTDIDFIGSNNFPAIDTLNQLGYCWTDWDSTQTWYDQTKLPAVGYVMLYGPVLPEIGSTAIFNGKEKTGYKNLPLTAFWGFHDDSYPDTSSIGPAYSRETAWNISSGLDKRGNQIIDPTTNQPTKFRYAGDPVNNTGWLSTIRSTSGGAGFYLFSGPFNMAPMDTQWVMFALTAAQGGDNLKSITELRRRAKILSQFNYDELVKRTEINIYDPTPPPIIPGDFLLYQNYPNPFNPSTTIRYSVPETSDITFTIFDILGSEVWSTVEQNKIPGTYELKWNGRNNHGNELSSGVYFLNFQSTKIYKSIKLMLIK